MLVHAPTPGVGRCSKLKNRHMLHQSHHAKPLLLCASYTKWMDCLRLYCSFLETAGVKNAGFDAEGVSTTAGEPMGGDVGDVRSCQNSSHCFHALGPLEGFGAPSHRRSHQSTSTSQAYSSSAALTFYGSARRLLSQTPIQPARADKLGVRGSRHHLTQGQLLLLPTKNQCVRPNLLYHVLYITTGVNLTAVLRVAAAATHGHAMQIARVKMAWGLQWHRPDTI